MTDAVVAEALHRLHPFGPEWGESALTNHGPMAVEVISRHGRSERIEPWLDRYLTRLDPMPRANARIGPDDWREALGDGRRVGDWTQLFRAELADADWPAVLATWWPRLLPGILAGATHGLIRTAHAVRLLADGPASALEREELAHGLAFWAARYRPAPLAITPTGSTGPADVLAAVPGVADPAGSMAQRFAQFPQIPELVEVAGRLQPPTGPADVPSRLAAVVDAAVLRYRVHGHASPVLLVHSATAPNAVLQVLPALPQQLWEPSLRAVWSAVVALRVAFENPAAPRPPGLDDDVDPGAGTAGVTVPGEVMARALDHGDEHVIKFADTALASFDRTGAGLAVRAAEHVATLIPSPPRG